MSDTKKREGWYAVKDSQGVWEPARWELTPEAGYAWWYRCGWYVNDESLGCEIGPRVYMPDEHDDALAALTPNPDREP